MATGTAQGAVLSHRHVKERSSVLQRRVCWLITSLPEAYELHSNFGDKRMNLKLPCHST